MTIARHKASRAKMQRAIYLLRRQLAAEKQLSGALCKLAFMPDQNPGHLKEVNRALTIRRKLNPRRDKNFTASGDVGENPPAACVPAEAFPLLNQRGDVEAASGIIHREGGRP